MLLLLLSFSDTRKNNYYKQWNFLAWHRPWQLIQLSYSMHHIFGISKTKKKIGYFFFFCKLHVWDQYKPKTYSQKPQNPSDLLSLHHSKHAKHFLHTLEQKDHWTEFPPLSALNVIILTMPCAISDENFANLMKFQFQFTNCETNHNIKRCLNKVTFYL